MLTVFVKRNLNKTELVKSEKKQEAKRQRAGVFFKVFVKTYFKVFVKRFCEKKLDFFVRSLLKAFLDFFC